MLKSFLKKFLFIPKFLPYFKYGKEIRPYFGIPKRNYGGSNLRTIKMIKYFGNFYFSPNIIYAQSWWTERELEDCINYSKKKNISIVFNQDGWFYSAWYKGDWKKRNRTIVKVQKISKKVIYQSQFCKITSKKLNNYINKNNVILYNPPLISKKINKNINKNKFNILLTGIFGKESKHILIPTLKAIKYLNDVKKPNFDYRLNIFGVIKNEMITSKWYNEYEKIYKNLRLKNLVKFHGKYKHSDIKNILYNTNLAIHTKYKDPCPNAVIEKLISGIPHVYSNSGGTPEIVGNAGISINVKNNWSKMEEVEYKLLADKILLVKKYEKKFIKNTFKQAKKFNEKKYMLFHRKLFHKLIN